jgi:hypothetical protein
MKKDLNLLDKFDLLIPIEPSPNWDKELQQRIQRSEKRTIGASGSHFASSCFQSILLF